MQKAVGSYHRKLREIWLQHQACDIPGFEWSPYLGQPIELPKRLKVLFIGLNPSFVSKVIARHWEVAHAGDAHLKAMKLRALKWPAMRAEVEWDRLLPAVVKLDRHSRGHYPRYYGPLGDLAEAAGAADAWDHLDLFPLRTTPQKALAKHLLLPEAWDEEFPSPLSALLEATLELIEAIDPKIVVVVNALAASTLEDRAQLIIQGNHHRYVCPLLPKVTFLLSSQLSGGATSKYAALRLLADLRDALRDGGGLHGEP
jgi:hypothetical protein